MKVCKYCGQENDDAAIACIGCGTDNFRVLPSIPEPGQTSSHMQAEWSGRVQPGGPPPLPGPMAGQFADSQAAAAPKKRWPIAQRLMTGLGVFFLLGAMKQFSAHVNDSIASIRNTDTASTNVKLVVAGTFLLLSVFYLIRSFGTAPDLDRAKLRPEPWAALFASARNWGPFALFGSFLLYAAQAPHGGNHTLLAIGTLLMVASGILTGGGAVWAIGLRSQPTRVWGPLLDATVNALFLGLMLFGILSGERRTNELHEWQRFSGQLSNSQAEIRSLLSTNPEDLHEAGHRMAQKMERMSEAASGERQLMLKAMAGMTTRGLAWDTNWMKTCQLFDDALDMTAVSTPEQLQSKKELLAKAFAELEILRGFRLEEAFRQELTQHKLSMNPKVIEAASSKFRLQQTLLDRMGSGLADYGENGRRMQEWFSSNWGRWKYSMASGNIEFDSQATAASFRVEQERLEQAGVFFQKTVQATRAEILKTQ